MELVMPVASNAQLPGAAVGGRTSEGKAGDAFLQTLTYQISSGETTAQSQSTGTAIAAVFAAGVLPGTAIEAVAESEALSEHLMALIDSLLEGLDEEASEEMFAGEEAQQQLLAMLDQMNALLTLLGGPAVRLDGSVLSGETEQSGLQGSGGNTAAIVVALQNSLLQLHAMLQQGTPKRIQGQEPLPLIERQLGVLAATVMAGSDNVGEQPAASKQAKSGSASLNNVVAATDSHSAHLLRITSKAVHPSFLTAAQSVEADSVVRPEAAASSPLPDSTLAAHPLASLTAGARDVTPLIAKGGAPTAFVQAEQFAETMNSLIVQKFSVRSLNGLSEARLQLFPEQLGQVDVKISMQNGVLTALFQTDTARAKDLLENQMAQLRAALQTQGLNVDRLEVTQAEPSIRLSHHHPGQGEGGRKPSEQGRQSDDNDGTRENAFELELSEQAAIQEMGYGRKINETA